jgi:hypothetical protein
MRRKPLVVAAAVLAVLAATVFVWHAVTSNPAAGLIRRPLLTQPTADTADAAGAQTAGLRIAAALNSADMNDPARRKRILARWCTPEAATRLGAGMAPGYRAAAAAFGDPDHLPADWTARTVPFGVRADPPDAGKTVVSIWEILVVGRTDPAADWPVRENWSTFRLHLSFTGAGWRATGWDTVDGRFR